LSTRTCLTVAISAVAVLAACNSPRGGRRARPDQIPEQVAVERGTTTYGFFTSRERLPIEVSEFRIAKWPTTIAQYKDCIASGGCPPPANDACLHREGGGPLDAPNYEDEAEVDEQLPATCVGIGQAQAYCAWVGGALPTISQWLTAVRGREVTRFAWGNRLPGCEHRPEVAASRGAVPCRGAADPSFAVGHHAANASPFGVEDVLFAPGELLASAADAPLQSCSAPFAACVAYGVRPGAIDSAAPLDGVGTEEGERSPHPYAFRCVFPGESR
jgi:formylglycine-generating enzyme required for sulfatase activity